jgi:hypothetical protein
MKALDRPQIILGALEKLNCQPIVYKLQKCMIGVCINLEDIMANEISQTQKGKYYMVLFICGSKNVEFI